jgi:hypothetical protein
MSFRSAIDAVDLESIGASWVQANRENFVFNAFPRTKCGGFRTGRSSTTYKLPKLNNSLGGGAAMQDFSPGDSGTEEKELGSIDATFTPRSKRSKVISRPANRQGRHILRDLEVNVVPFAFSAAYQQIEHDLLAFMASSAYGSGKTFSGTGALDTYASDQKPDADINSNLMPMVKWKHLGLSLECVMSEHVMTVLARHPAYTGAGTGSGVASTLGREEFTKRFLASHPQVQRLHICSTVEETARDGQTSAVRVNGNTLLWFGLVDRRATYDMLEDGSLDAPDGAIMIAMAVEPEVADWMSLDKSVERFAGQAEYAIYFPRASDASAADFAHFYTASEIFTSNPA